MEALLDGVWRVGFGPRLERLAALDALPRGVAAIVGADYLKRAGDRPLPIPYPYRDQRPERDRARAPISWSTWADAGEWLRRTARDLVAARVPFAFSEHDLAERAAVAARLCMATLRHPRRCVEFAAALGVTVRPPDGRRGPSWDGLRRRFFSARWWHRRLRAAWSMAAESGLRAAGMVHRHASPYASGETVRRRQQQRRRNSAFLAERVALCEQTGEQLSLFDVAAASLANPALRRAEFMVRLRGFDEIGRDCGHVAQFVTITTPSRFHARGVAGEPNPRHDGTTARDAQLYLRALWARARAKLKRLSVLVYGFRIAEPHHDGTPHWHLILWTPPQHAGTLRAVLGGYALAESPGEPGAARHRFTVERIDPARGAVGYVAKYVAKNIDGHAVGVDLESDTPATDSVQAVDAWASTFRVRQFQQIGGPPVGLWRELRRAREPVDCEPIERARFCADAGDWGGFVRALGGIEHCRRSPLVVERKAEGLNEWGEPAAPRPVGVRCGAVLVVTREKVWTIVLRPKPGHLGPVSITVRGRGDPSPPEGLAAPFPAGAPTPAPPPEVRC